MRRAPQAGDAGGDAGEGIGARRAGQPHRRGRGVLLVIGMQDEDGVQRLGQHRIDLVLLRRHREAHAQEVLGVAQMVQRIDEGLADAVLERHRRDGRDLGDQTMAGDLALARIGDVGRVVIEGRQRAHHAAHDRHRMGVAAEAAEEGRELLMHHGVHGDGAVEVLHLLLVRQLAVEQQVADLQEARMRGQLVDRIAAIEQHALVAVDEGDVAFAARRSR